jgi:DNA/RNA endonuclease G (NUC1)
MKYDYHKYNTEKMDIFYKKLEKMTCTFLKSIKLVDKAYQAEIRKSKNDEKREKLINDYMKFLNELIVKLDDLKIPEKIELPSDFIKIYSSIAQPRMKSVQRLENWKNREKERKWKNKLNRRRY